METRRLQYFLHIADASSISKAAAVAGLAQPALSRQLAILEAELKTQLVERSASGVRLTAAGHALYARAQIIVRQVAGLKVDLGGGAAGIAGPVAIGLAPSHELFLGLPLVARVMERYPLIQLQMLTSGLVLTQLQVGLVDLALAPGDVNDPSVDAEPLFAEDMLLIQAAGAPPPPTDLPSLAVLPWIVTRVQSAVHGALGSIFLNTGLQPNLVAEINSLPLMLHAAKLGMGVTLLPRAAVSEAVARGEVSAWKIGDPPLRRTIWLCSRRKPAVTPGVAAVAELIREIVAEQTQQDSPGALNPGPAYGQAFKPALAAS